MYGKVYLETLAELAEFLAEFAKTNSTAVFTVRWGSATGGPAYCVEFTGGQ